MSKNVFSYLSKYGNKSFRQMLLNEIDASVFAQLAYVRFEKVFKTYPITIKEVADMFLSFDKKTKKQYSLYDIDVKFLKLLVKSKRFANLEIFAIINNFSIQNETQVCAYAVKLPSNECVVAYRGTDESLLGWKEAIKLGFSDKNAGQEVARKFFESVVKKETKKKFYIVGHSKGGNFAIYTVATVSPKIADKIKMVYNFDGPNIVNKLKKTSYYYEREDKILTLLPKASIVGAVLEQVKNVKIVDSESFSVLQHVMYYWKVNGASYKTLDKRTRFSMIFEHSFRKWLFALPKSVTEKVVTLLFGMTDKANIRTVEDFLNTKKAGNFIHSLFTDIGKRKEAYKKYLKQFIDDYVSESKKESGKNKKKN